MPVSACRGGPAPELLHCSESRADQGSALLSRQGPPGRPAAVLGGRVQVQYLASSPDKRAQTLLLSGLCGSR